MLGELLTLKQLQEEAETWRDHNFPDYTWEEQFMGVVEEVGELSHALIKQKQGIRGSFDKHEADAMDAVGDMLVFLSGLCSARGWSMQDILEETWAQVKQRDWQKNKESGNA